MNTRLLPVVPFLLVALFGAATSAHSESAPSKAPALPGVASPGTAPVDSANDAAAKADSKAGVPTAASKAGVPTAASKAAAPATDPKPAATAASENSAAPAATKKPATPAKAGKSAAAAATPKPAAAPAATAAEAEAVWKAYEKRWSETEDYAAGFRQTIEVPDVGSTIESAGRFYFAKPGLVRWDYIEGPPQTVVGDGTWIWLYQPDLEQVYKIPYAKAFGRGGLVELLAGRTGLAERYQSSLERPDAATVRILLKSLTEGAGDFEVTLSADTFDLQAVTVHDAAGSTTHMTFAEPRRNVGSDPEKFTFTPPGGVDIIADNEMGF